ncbi:EAL domain-containing protein [Leptolyngbya sp. PCC 6406]|uniref:two-component system response regulator n=1 Tax=Leptolyngbya sp. PCC 6406 TaxID=1173264 RepID=UPI0002ABF735|nr:EAL domain-containing protein [Leptolyngbya sp. PCC 6406]
MIQERNPKSTILVVDDIPENLHLLTRELTIQGYEVRGVLTGEMALLVTHSTTIDLILLDVMLPGLDGYTVCQTLKNNPQTQDIPVIFLSALDGALDKVRAFAVGGVDYVSKPFNIVEVIARIETQINLRQTQLRLQQFTQDLEQRVKQRTHELEVTNQSLQAEIHNRQKIEDHLRTSEERYRLIANHMGDLVCLHGMDGQLLYVSPSSQALLGYAPEALIGQNFQELCHPEDSICIQLDFQKPIKADDSLCSCYRVKRQSGQYIWLETIAKPLIGEAGEMKGVVTSSRDVTRRVKIERQLRHDSLHDALTGLPNRDWLARRLELELSQCQRYDGFKFGLLMIDLDRFKAINDSLGHLIGDKLLIAVGNVLKTCVRDVDMVARWGGDEFVVFLDRISDIKEAIQIAERIRDSLSDPLEIEEKLIFTSASIGILMGDSTYQNSNDVFRDVDIALYRAKGAGRNRYEIFGWEMYQEAIDLLNLENDLRLAIREQGFVTYYQPIFSLQTDKLIGFEALARWQHPQKGLIMPDDFIDLAEDTGLIKPIGEQILQQVCSMVRLWENSFDLSPDFRISINVSGQQFRDPKFIQTIDQALSHTGIHAKHLKLEITERILLEQSESIIQILAELKKRGIQLSIDDFGTGYSSLRYLSQFSVNTLKIDRSFVTQMQANQQGIVQAVIDLAHNLGMDAIAEGVDSAQQLEHLKRLGCEAAQGYFFSPPLLPEAATALIQGLGG